MTARDVSRTATNKTISQPESQTSAEIEERVRLRAYELYLQRGMQDGFAEQDWLQAESELLSVHTALKAVA